MDLKAYFNQADIVMYRIRVLGRIHGCWICAHDAPENAVRQCHTEAPTDISYLVSRSFSPFELQDWIDGLSNPVMVYPRAEQSLRACPGFEPFDFNEHSGPQDMTEVESDLLVSLDFSKEIQARYDLRYAGRWRYVHLVEGPLSKLRDISAARSQDQDVQGIYVDRPIWCSTGNGIPESFWTRSHEAHPCKVRLLSRRQVNDVSSFKDFVPPPSAPVNTTTPEVHDADPHMVRLRQFVSSVFHTLECESDLGPIRKIKRVEDAMNELEDGLSTEVFRSLLRDEGVYVDDK